ncbi:MAG: adenylate kinase [Victivallaceae bacterium]|nr:adenylate kinase [Victivallaceae bacterium]
MLSKNKVIFLGAPGAGKGTFSAMLLEQVKLAHISTGDILRAEVASGSELGKQAAIIMQRGELLPDEIVAAMVKSRLAQDDCREGFILDGFPRTTPQAELLKQALQELDNELDGVIFFKVEDELLLKRLSGRISCKACGEIYNRYFQKPAVDMICDKCGGELFQRPDDSIETARERLKVFYEQTEPLIDYYRQQGLLLTITEVEKNKAFAALLELLQ